MTFHWIQTKDWNTLLQRNATTCHAMQCVINILPHTWFTVPIATLRICDPSLSDLCVVVCGCFLMFSFVRHFIIYYWRPNLDKMMDEKVWDHGCLQVMSSKEYLQVCLCSTGSREEIENKCNNSNEEWNIAIVSQHPHRLIKTKSPKYSVFFF